MATLETSASLTANHPSLLSLKSPYRPTLPSLSASELVQVAKLIDWNIYNLRTGLLPLQVDEDKRRLTPGS
jgi:hypothetical protein